MVINKSIDKKHTESSEQSSIDYSLTSLNPLMQLLPPIPIASQAPPPIFPVSQMSFRRIPKMPIFTAEELLEIGVSVLAICLALTLAIGGNTIQARIFQSPDEFTSHFILFLLTVAPAFVLHEMGHKFMALRLGHYARFKAWIGGLVFMFILGIFTGFIFAAPGAVYIMMTRRGSKRENGLISIAGPSVNITLGFIGLILLIVFGNISSLTTGADAGTNIFNLDFITLTLLFTVYINGFFAAFNMIPMFPLDGVKIFSWRKDIWLLMYIISLGLIFIIGGGEAITFILTLTAFAIFFNMILGYSMMRRRF